MTVAPFFSGTGLAMPVQSLCLLSRCHVLPVFLVLPRGKDHLSQELDLTLQAIVRRVGSEAGYSPCGNRLGFHDVHGIQAVQERQPDSLAVVLRDE